MTRAPFIPFALVFAVAGCSGPQDQTAAPTMVQFGEVEEHKGAEISRSPGVDDGVVVLWPRVAPRSDEPAARTLAGELQERLRALAEKTLPGRPVDVRPEPERVCPRAGCRGVSLGAVLSRKGSVCAAVAVVSAPGASPARLVPWAGAVRLKRAEVPFREPPESEVTVTDWLDCGKLAEALSAREADVEGALRGAAAPR